MRTVIVGCDGQLGQEFRSRLPQALALSRADLDLTRPEECAERLRAHEPQCVLNCASYNAVDDAEREAAAAMAVNALSVRSLAQVCSDFGATFVHFSTNYAFGRDQQRTTPYHETDVPGPVSTYGISKVAGEEFAQTYCARHFVIRTTGLFGVRLRHGRPANFIQKLAERARRGERLRVVDDQICSPTAVWDLAEATLRLLETQAYGLYHLTSNDACTWHEFAQTALQLEGLDVRIDAVTSAELGAPAQRPLYSVLACDRYDRLGFAPRPTWQEALATYARGGPGT